MTPPEFTPRLVIDEQTQLALRTLYQTFRAKPRMAKFLRAARAMLADKFRDDGLDIQLRDCSSAMDRARETVMLGVFVNGVADQALIFGTLKPDGTIYGTAANENAAHA